MLAAIAASGTLPTATNSTPKFCVISFLEDVFHGYADVRDNRPTETLLLTYARMLQGANGSVLNGIREYRNQVLRLEQILPLLGLPAKWRPGEL